MRRVGLGGGAGLGVGDGAGLEVGVGDRGAWACTDVEIEKLEASLPLPRTGRRAAFLWFFVRLHYQKNNKKNTARRFY